MGHRGNKCEFKDINRGERKVAQKPSVSPNFRGYGRGGRRSGVTGSGASRDYSYETLCTTFAPNIGQAPIRHRKWPRKRAGARPCGFDARGCSHVTSNDGRFIDAGRRAAASGQTFAPKVFTNREITIISSYAPSVVAPWDPLRNSDKSKDLVILLPLKRSNVTTPPF